MSSTRGNRLYGQLCRIKPPVHERCLWTITPKLAEVHLRLDPNQFPVEAVLRQRCLDAWVKP